MYDAIAHSDLRQLTAQEQNLYVVSAGSYNFSPGDNPISCFRPEGRSDYHFYCVLNGKSECIVDGQTHIIGAGQAVFYDYDAPQGYVHHADNGTKIYWIHFDGGTAKEILRECGFMTSCIFPFDNSVASHFEDILHELTFKDELYIKASSASLYSIIVSFARGLHPAHPRDERMEHVLYMMHNKIHNSKTLDDYAKISGLSKPQFIKRFTKYTGITPMRYRNERIINSAVWYLQNTSISIKEISALLKFENAYYFSNMFKKNMGMSPKEYREKYNAGNK